MISLLYVDDDSALLDLCRVFLEQEGDISVVTESSVKEALGRLDTGQFDAIISDYQMLEIDGITFLRKVRQRLLTCPFFCLPAGVGRRLLSKRSTAVPIPISRKGEIPGHSSRSFPIG
ncbi:MAG: response regulator [Methanoregula sp.]